jgi:hypothetical protein
MSRLGKRMRPSSTISSWTPATFNPALLSPWVWYDAADSTTITSSAGKVSQWNDKSTNGRNLTQATSSAQPSTGTNTMNGLNLITFNGSSTTMSTSAFTMPATMHVFAVMKQANFTTRTYNSLIWQANAGETAGYEWLTISLSKQILYMIQGAGNYISFDSSATVPTVNTLSINTSYLMEFSWSGSRLFAYVNSISDVAVPYAKTMTTGSFALRIGDSVVANRWFQGDWAEIICFTGELSQANQALVRNYLNSKWAIY